jgi:hypothetical protein
VLDWRISDRNDGKATDVSKIIAWEVRRGEKGERETWKEWR